MRLFDIGMPVLPLGGAGIFFPLFQNLQKVSATNRECNVAKQCAEALEWRLKTRQKSICAVRTRQRSFKPRSESDTLYPRSAFLTRFQPGMEVVPHLD